MYARMATAAMSLTASTSHLDTGDPGVRRRRSRQSTASNTGDDSRPHATEYWRRMHLHRPAFVEIRDNRIRRPGGADLLLVACWSRTAGSAQWIRPGFAIDMGEKIRYVDENARAPRRDPMTIGNTQPQIDAERRGVTARWSMSARRPRKARRPMNLLSKTTDSEGDARRGSAAPCARPAEPMIAGTPATACAVRFGDSASSSR